MLPPLAGCAGFSVPLGIGTEYHMWLKLMLRGSKGRIMPVFTPLPFPSLSSFAASGAAAKCKFCQSMCMLPSCRWTGHSTLGPAQTDIEAP